MKQHIYADNAATTKLDKAAFEAMTPWLLEEYGNASQPYAFARKPKKALADARATIAECIGALPKEIYFTSGGTESNNWVIKSSAFSDPEERATITSAFEHHAVLRSCAAIERLGYSVAYMWPSDEGYITPGTLEKYITDNTRLVSVMLANNEIGSIQPIRELCEAAHAHGALFHTDAVQAVGHIKIDVHELGVDFLSASAHKFNGPKGIGFLYIRNGVELPPYADGGAQESAHRAGTENVAAIVSMATALKANCNLLEQNQQHILSLERQLISKLNESGVAYKRNGGDSKLPGLLSLSFPGKDGEAILHRTDLMGISISTGSACDSVNTEISHVLQAIRLDEDYAKGTIRISLGKNNTEEEVERIAAALVRILL
jgi:Cysteine sulfinate desulfinase/cysteine desulfurase and related enzymes